MPEHTVPLRAVRRLSVAAFGSVLLAVSALSAQPPVNAPLPAPLFSIDRPSPTTSAMVSASAILSKPGPMVTYPGANLQLLDPSDELDDFSYNRWAAAEQTPSFLLLFSVDRTSLGARPPDSSLAATGRCFNVQDQADRHQVPADLFLTLDDFTKAGPVGPKSGGRAAANNNTLAVNQGDTGGVDICLSPAASPVQRESPSEPLDNADALAYPDNGGSKDRNPRFYFTLSADSPSLTIRMPGTTGQQSGADVFAVANPGLLSTPEIYASAQSLGLLPTPGGDDIAALVVFDNGNGVFNPGVDEILFTLARGSPSLALHQFGPADILVSRGNGYFSLYASADSLGLLPTDHVDALEIVPAANPSSAVFDHAIYRVWPGDYDKNGILDQADCAAFPACYSGPGVPYDADAATYTVQTGPGPVFAPNTVTVQVGDSVHWVWVDGPHNVVSGAGGAPDGMFNSGPPDYPPRTFDVTFSPALLDLYPRSGWVYPYFSSLDYAVGMIGTVVVQAHPSAVFDLDYDGDVDCADWRAFQPIYSEASGGGACLPLSVSDFVAALVGAPILPGHVCLADMNGDGYADGLDIQPYVDAVLP